MRSTRVALVAVVLGGCAELHDQPAFLINERSVPVSVSFTFQLETGGSNAGIAPCVLERSRNPIWIHHAKEAYRRQLRAWDAAELTNLDPVRCSASTELPAGKALLMFWNGTCSDYAKAGTPPPVPTLQRLQITGGGPPIQLTGFDTAKAFKASSRRKDCRLVVK